MERARDFRDKARDQASDYTEKAKDQVVDFASRAQQAARDLRGRVGGAGRPTGEQEEEKLSDQLRRGRDESVELGRETVDIMGELSTLMKEEVRLAKIEMAHQANLAVRSVIWVISAALFSVVMLIFLFVAFMLTLNLVLALWIGAFVTTGILGILVVIAGSVAYRRVRELRLTPEQTIESVKEDVEWARNQMRPNER